jgi:PAS domain S-box-containing protein
MIWQYSPYYIPFIACGCITLILAVTGWRNRSHICAKPFALLMLAASIWSFGSALEVSAADPVTQMFAVTLQYPGIVTVPVAWLLFAFEYTGREHWITRNNLAFLFAVPCLSILLVATNSAHHLFYSSVTQEIIGGVTYPDIIYGPFFWFFSIYTYLIIYLGVMFIVQRFVFTSGLYRGQMIAILIAIFTPFFVNLAYAIRQIGFIVIDPTPFAFIISGFAIIIGMLRYQLLDLTPMAQDQVIANMSDGVVVLDTRDRITSLNTPAERILGVSLRQSIGLSVKSLLPCSCLSDALPEDSGRFSEEMHEMDRMIDGKKQYFEVRRIPILSHENEVKGRLIIIRDITSQKLAEIALAQARKKLNLLSSITRHDILNQVTVLLLNIDTVKESVIDPSVRELLEIQEGAVKNIQHQIEFARDYENLGGKAPRWMNLGEIFSNLHPVMGTYGITFSPTETDREIYADQLLERVFYNLVDNSIRHGGHVTLIGIRCEKNPDGLVITYYDNGIGIPMENKEHIFERGVGKHTGLGLFLAREILEITGLTICETGVFGYGARFEIHVPEDQQRIRNG